MVFRHQTLDVFHDKVNNCTFGSRKLVAHPRQNNVLYRRFFDHFFQRMGKVRNNNDCRRAAIVKLMLKFARRIKWVNIHHNHASA
ncbi:Uncharacterised protein [Salmonella enterica subsp. arizonae]|nr:Uncharacterised protein [Salmonella enterica subsp. arizonae]